MFNRLCDNRQRILGAFLFAVALVTLLSNPPGDWKYLQLVVFIVCLAGGYLLTSGVVGVHATAASRRRNGRTSPGDSPGKSLPMERQAFRYGSTPWRRALAVGTCVSLGIGQMALGVTLAVILWHESVGAAVVCGGIALGGLVLCDYARRYLRVCIEVDAEHITSRLYYRSVRMRWNEVVALVQQRCVAPLAIGGGGLLAAGGLEVGRIYLVYSSRDKIWFSNSLVDAEMLVQIVSERTGLPWEQGDGMPVA